MWWSWPKPFILRNGRRDIHSLTRTAHHALALLGDKTWPHRISAPPKTDGVGIWRLVVTSSLMNHLQFRGCLFSFGETSVVFVLLHHNRELHKYELQKSRQTKPNLMYHLNSAYFRHCYDFWFTPEKDMFLRKQIYKTSKLGSVFLVDSLQTISLTPCNNVVKIVLNSQKCCFFGSII